MVEVIWVTRQFRAVKKSSISSGTKREGKSSKGKEKLDNMLLEAVDETMKQIFRDDATKVIYDYLANNSHLNPEEIAEKPQAFSAGLDGLLGSAAPVIENLILKNLYSKLKLKFEEKKSYKFSDHIKELRKSSGC